MEFKSPETFLRLRQVRALVGFGRTQIYRRINEDTFPRPVRLGPQSVAWVESEVREWMQQRILERDESA
jgi:prophage regulatory protein